MARESGGVSAESLCTGSAAFAFDHVAQAACKVLVSTRLQLTHTTGASGYPLLIIFPPPLGARMTSQRYLWQMVTTQKLWGGPRHGYAGRAARVPAVGPLGHP